MPYRFCVQDNEAEGMEMGEAREAAEIMGNDWVSRLQVVGEALSSLGVQVLIPNQLSKDILYFSGAFLSRLQAQNGWRFSAAADANLQFPPGLLGAAERLKLPWIDTLIYQIA